MIDSLALLADLKAQLRILQADLRERADDPTIGWGAALQREHAEALRRERTGLSWSAWRDNEVDQAAVAWIVATTFIRFCEDNDLLVGATRDGMPVPVGWIAGPGDRTARARENQTAYFRVNTSHHDRDWLQQAFRVLAAQPAGAGLVDPKHNPVWTAEISAEAATGLLSFWRRTDDDSSLVHDFTDPCLDTRFLGDLYQDLSEHAKKTYALLQTPVFVEQFILDRTLTPAIAEFGIDGLKLIDPTCGSGHFLLGAFERLNEQWAVEAPGMDPKQRVRKAMDSIYGVDLNPFAVAIARFRLTVAGIRAAGEKSLVGVPELGFHLAIGDSLLGEQGVARGLFDEDSYTYITEDVREYTDILKPGRYHVVVGNPPYITVKDRALNAAYRKAYATCKGKYALSVPFAELFFRLAIRGEHSLPAGYVGQITSNSFMKREFGKKVIEDFFAGKDPGLAIENPVDLTHVLDIAGAWIPGHNHDGTPTVILIGRRRRPVSSTVRVVQGVRDDPGKRRDPENGPVWCEMMNHLEEPGFEGSFISVVDLKRSKFATHPWSLSGGGAGDVKSAVDAAGVQALSAAADSIGITCFTLEDEVYIRDPRALERIGVQDHRPMVLGDSLRDWTFLGQTCALFPYNENLDPVEVDDNSALGRAMWPFRTNLSNSTMFSGRSKIEDGLRWTEYGRLTKSKLRIRLSIAFAEVATHNHFILDRGGKVFKQTAPVIKLPAGATVQDHLDLLGILNSSTACFWLKEVCKKKGGDADTPWLRTYQFNSTRVGGIPLPGVLPGRHARVLDELSRAAAAASPHAVIEKFTRESTRCDGPSRKRSFIDLQSRLADAEAEWRRTRERLIFAQEELDWEVYKLYGLLDEDLTYAGSFDRVDPSERAFAIRMAREVGADSATAQWFNYDDPRTGQSQHFPRVPDLPDEWPKDYRELVVRRLATLDTNSSLRLIERPEFKRRWAVVPWERQLDDVLKDGILDRLEVDELFTDSMGPATRSVVQLVELIRNDEVFLELVRALTSSTEPNIAAVLTSLCLGEAVPYLAAHRYKASGLEKFREWQLVWDLQRRQDKQERVKSVPVPPRYDSADFASPEYWRARGKLDVPKERFILYPGVGREGDTSPVLGWAGWNHRDRAIALVREILNQQALGATDSVLVPMVAGLVELEPWLHQWHTDLEPKFGSSAAQTVTSQIDQFLTQLQLTRDDVNAWRPPAPTRGRRPQS
ncbi:BREX-2 system adenine-specific DNA-methyltransferase PglX [Brevibacterium daeguense]|uniref:site-specific DNA-methyltransferase (adenine-specific) n=1 Tax=Brevibacterium daeguense TaxID=909936 RepID=A0ABP8EFI5_9MICO|nr:BREX-2 system adenine-specific DNA-methyltransferase PglX [Brevibacterium daeguense]